MHILLVDDNEKLCQLYQQLLMRGGHVTRTVTNPSVALDAIRQEKPELVLLDIMMEPISGWEVLEQVRADSECADIPVIILTGKVLTAQEALKYGLLIEGFVMKPLERTMLLAAIDEVKSLLDESEERYSRAISSGMSSEKASECKKAVKKKKILHFLRETLTKQEQLLKNEPGNTSEILQRLDELRTMITNELQQTHQTIDTCP